VESDAATGHDMQDYFYNLSDSLVASCRKREVLLLNFSAERSDFVRFNRSAVRQPGSVDQRYVSLELIDGQKHASATTVLTGEAASDRSRCIEALERLRADLSHLPDDPYLLYAETPQSGEQIGEDKLPDSRDALDAILSAGEGRDMVGIYAAGGIYGGFANSLGQRNWFATHSFHVDWCFYREADKAVKTSYAGFAWDAGEFARKVAEASEQADILTRPAKTIEPGEYRVYLAPRALREIVELLGWGGFGLKAQRTKNTPLLKMLEDGQTLDERVTIRENTREGLSPNFQGAGFVKPEEVVLIDRGRFAGALVSPRSAKEYGEETNGASAWEAPESLDVSAGDVPASRTLERLGEGAYVNTLWYLNYSDRPAGRITGMTRFATFWVEGGQIVAPLNVMRFDDSIYRVLGSNLIGLTRQRDFMPSAETYGGRSTDSARLPGVLIEDFRLTL